MPSAETRGSETSAAFDRAEPASRSAGRAGAAGAEEAAGAAGVVSGGAPALVVRDGQITPPHSRSLHLKSGAFGFRFPSRLSHIGPRHLGQVGVAIGFELGGVMDVLSRTVPQASALVYASGCRRDPGTAGPTGARCTDRRADFLPFCPHHHTTRPV